MTWIGDMFITQRHLPRRTVLRGMGAALALPLLDAMVPAGVALAQTAARPLRRLGFVYMPNGVARNFTGINYWTPVGEGANFELSQILTPLAPYRDRLTVISGLAQHQADAFDDGANGDHTRGTSSWLSGVHCKRTEGADVKNGTTADQIAAAEIGKTTALPSLELAIDLNFLAGQCENSYSCAYLNTLSWRSETAPMPTMCARPSRAPGCWRAPASPRSCRAISAICPTPVGPIGWPIASRPPDGLTATSPPMSNAPARSMRGASPGFARPIASR